MRSSLLSGRLAAGAMVAAVGVGGFGPTDAARAQDLSLELVDSGYSRPVFATYAPGDTDHLYIIEQHSGDIRVLDLTNPAAAPTTFLNVNTGAPNIATGGEQGLLGLAFHPDYATNGHFYVYTTRTTGNGDTSVERYTQSGSAAATAATRQVVLTFDQPQTNHNGGWIGFGHDGYLYIASGDGGGSFDSGTGHTSGVGNGQDITNNLLGTMLRIDVDGDDFASDPNRNYAIPDSNPFVGVTGDDEIWAYGLRNPWRSSFDRDTGDLYIADVGQGLREEINFQHADSAGGENYGWRLREGTIQTPNVGGPLPPGAVDPVYDYAHGSGNFQGFSVAGGYVYRGPITQARGDYYFADSFSDNIWSIEVNRETGGLIGGVVRVNGELAGGDLGISTIVSFGEDSVGNLYLVTLGGGIYRLTTNRVLGDMDGSYATSNRLVGLDVGDVALFGQAIYNSQAAFESANPGADYLAGDTNQDGSVNDEDARSMLDFLLGSHVDSDTISRFFDAVLPGDLTEDGYVGVDDLDLILANWEQAGITAGDHSRGDANNDGLVNTDDLNLVLSNFGVLLPGFTPGQPVPEPGSLAVLGLLGLGLLRRRRH